MTDDAGPDPWRNVSKLPAFVVRWRDPYDRDHLNGAVLEVTRDPDVAAEYEGMATAEVTLVTRSQFRYRRPRPWYVVRDTTTGEVVTGPWHNYGLVSTYEGDERYSVRAVIPRVEMPGPTEVNIRE